jgi:hypothetical protein
MAIPSSSMREFADEESLNDESPMFVGFLDRTVELLLVSAQERMSLPIVLLSACEQVSWE